MPKLPAVGATIFSRMSPLAAQHGASNLGQGFPDFDCDPALLAAVNRALHAGHNQYPPMPGLPLLRQRVAARLLGTHGRAYRADSEITITAGATQSLFTAIQCSAGVRDAVILIEPAYDSYIPAIRLARAPHPAAPPSGWGAATS